MGFKKGAGRDTYTLPAFGYYRRIIAARMITPTARTTAMLAKDASMSKRPVFNLIIFTFKHLQIKSLLPDSHEWRPL
ncbi:MAG: hypothetical protein HY954_12340 [Deltaproteobacteria bacterium]|nr:hypothetical protein [Deltaproteobacteria bacterium]